MADTDHEDRIIQYIHINNISLVVLEVCVIIDYLRHPITCLLAALIEK